MWKEMTNSAILEEIGQRLKDTRLRKNIQQKELAERCGISLPSVQRVEKGSVVSMETLVSVMRGLGLLENFEQLLPEAPISPLLMKKLKGKMRKRAGNK